MKEFKTWEEFEAFKLEKAIKLNEEEKKVFEGYARMGFFKRLWADITGSVSKELDLLRGVGSCIANKDLTKPNGKHEDCGPYVGCLCDYPKNWRALVKAAGL